MPADYEVGYGKPPRHSRFQKGRSGNPKGRSKGTRDLASDLKEELAERILVREGDASRQISKQRAVLKRLFDRALKGEVGALRILLELITRLGEITTAASEPTPLSAEERALLADLTLRLRRRGAEPDESEALATTGKPVGGEG